MKISFPYMGPVILYQKILEKFGHEVIMPTRPNKTTFDLGVKNSPEYACFPFKVLTGTYIQSCERGVEVIGTSGGHGPCRAGYYGEIHKRILKQMGYDVEFIIFDSLFRNRKKFWNQMRRITNHHNIFQAIPTFIYCYKLLQTIDHFEKRITRIRPYELVKGSVDDAWEKINRILSNTDNKEDLLRDKEICDKLLDSIETYSIPEAEKLRIGIVGEIYVVMEPSVNGNIEKKLNDLGCETHRSQYLLEWVDYHIFPTKSKKQHERDIIEKGSEYIKINIGGHAQQTVGSMVDFHERNYDGIIHLMPFSCLPELVSQSITNTLSKKIPIMTLSLDEQSGEANNQTRIEAFVDLLRSRKMKKARLA
jgi:predicted nucleotide-binding protein (sugar kinase/HSP70/actin superfamily)